MSCLRQNTLILYSREQCPLCVKAKQVLEEVKRESQVDYIEVDIHSDDDLLEKYGLMIPVIEWNERIIQYGNIDKSAIFDVLEK